MTIFIFIIVGLGLFFVIGFAALRVIVAFEDVSVFAINTITLLGLGLAIDYSLFLVNRFREELETAGVEAAIVRTMQTTGRAVAFSGLTVAASLCGLFVFEQMLLRSLALKTRLMWRGYAFLPMRRIFPDPKPGLPCGRLPTLKFFPPIPAYSSHPSS